MTYSNETAHVSPLIYNIECVAVYVMSVVKFFVACFISEILKTLALHHLGF